MAPVTLQLTVLGSSGSHPGAGRACSGYLLRTPDATVLVDCGNGSTMTMHELIGAHEIDAIFLSHKHIDHCADLIGLYLALRFHDDGPRAVDVYAPAGVRDQLAGLSDSIDEFDRVCRFVEVGHGDHVEVNGLAVDLFASTHTVPTVSMRATDGGTVVAYSADSSGGPALVDCARDADLFVCEATWQGEPGDYPPGLHLTARGAAQVAAEAGVGHLVLTHLWPRLDGARSLEEAASGFDGELSLAMDGVALSPAPRAP